MKESKHIKLNIAKWNRWAKSADGKGRLYEFLRKSQSKVISLLELKENMSFLDIGCGTGWALGQIAKSVNGKGTFYGVELSPKMVEKAKENFGDDRNFHFINSNAESIPLDDNLFDYIICTNSFHHYLHPDKALKEMHRLLKPGAKVYILDPAADFMLAGIINKIFRLIEPAHVKIYSTKEFKQLFIEAGLNYTGNIKAEGQKIQVGEKPA